MIAITLLFALLACDSEGWEPIIQVDEGTSCLEAATADGTGTITVDANVCLSSSCSRNATASCAATLDGTTITVTSEFAWEEATGETLDCTADCGMLAASCDVGPLAAGSYLIVHGAESTTVEVPTTGACAEGPRRGGLTLSLIT
ncbi:MAG: hypothetical protein Q8P18_03620 [Pseudomonadota bacterium]|nr:hypothetical protein [Pseudomonadota bacterium]